MPRCTGECITNQSKIEITKKKRRVVESDDDEEEVAANNDDDVDMEKKPTDGFSDSSERSTSTKPAKKRAKHDSNIESEDSSTEIKPEAIREEIKEIAKAQLDQIKEAPQDSKEPSESRITASSVQAVPKTEVAKIKPPKWESQVPVGHNPFSMAKAKPTSAKSGSAKPTNGEKPASATVQKGKGRGKRDPDDSDEDDKASPNDTNYSPDAGEDDDHDSVSDADMAGEGDAEAEEEADEEEEEQTSKAAASKLWVQYQTLEELLLNETIYLTARLL